MYSKIIAFYLNFVYLVNVMDTSGQGAVAPWGVVVVVEGEGGV